MPITPRPIRLLRVALLAGAIGVVQLGCGASPETPSCAFDAPPWRDKLPDDEQFVYGVAGERSAGGIQRAREKAEASAREQIAARIQTSVQRLTGRLIEDLELDATDGKVRTYTETISRQVVGQSLSGVETVEFADDPCTGVSWALVRLGRETYTAALRASARAGLGPLELDSERLRQAIEVLDALEARGEADLR